MSEKVMLGNNLYKEDKGNGRFVFSEENWMEIDIFSGKLAFSNFFTENKFKRNEFIKNSIFKIFERYAFSDQSLICKYEFIRRYVNLVEQFQTEDDQYVVRFKIFWKELADKEDENSEEILKTNDVTVHIEEDAYYITYMVRNPKLDFESVEFSKKNNTDDFCKKIYFLMEKIAGTDKFTIRFDLDDSFIPD